MISLVVQASLLCLLITCTSCHDINVYNSDYGVYVGDLSSPESDVSGQVFIVNATTLQIFNFTFNPDQQDLYFWLDIKDTPTKEGIKAHTYEYGITPLGPFPEDNDRVVVHVPEKHRLDEFKSFSIYSFKTDKNFGSLVLPEDMKIPKSVALSSEFTGKRYKLRSGPLYVLDRRTIKVYGFTFEGNKAPKTYFYAGRGASVSYSSGVKVAIRGKDDKEISEISENYRGGKDIILELPENYDIFHIDWISVYCYKYRVNFGSVLVPTDDTLANLPPYVPSINRSDEEKPMSRRVLKGSANRINFTFQLGHIEHIKNYNGNLRSPKYVWHVNSVMSPDLYLKRHVTYKFNVEGGRDKLLPDIYNPLYIGDDENGGYNELSQNEAERVTVYSPGPIDSHTGPLCLWMHNRDKTANEPETYLECDGWPEDVHSFAFTPNDTTPSVLYYNSANNFNMGGKIYIVDELPENVEDSAEVPYNREKWHTLALSRQRADKVNGSKTTIAAVFLIILTIMLS
uniref:DM13 domain-containing protein n=1 Tax=Caenorhabditis tropicalis TaxID=1561998 RepID=A0A1I7TJP9_9PELO